MPTALSVRASRPKVKHPGESILFGVDFTSLLTTGETLSSVSSVTAAPEGLTITSSAVNAAEFDNDEGGEVAIGKGVQFRVAEGAAGTDYALTVTATTSAGNTRVGVCILKVKDT